MPCTEHSFVLCGLKKQYAVSSSSHAINDVSNLPVSSGTQWKTCRKASVFVLAVEFHKFKVSSCKGSITKRSSSVPVSSNWGIGKGSMAGFTSSRCWCGSMPRCSFHSLRRKVAANLDTSHYEENKTFRYFSASFDPLMNTYGMSIHLRRDKVLVFN